MLAARASHWPSNAPERPGCTALAAARSTVATSRGAAWLEREPFDHRLEVLPGSSTRAVIRVQEVVTDERLNPAFFDPHSLGR